jgi:hypothetical protein
MKFCIRAPVLALTTAWLLLTIPQSGFAIDLQCDGADRKKHEELICDYSMLRRRYETIFREQQSLLQRRSSMQPAVMAWLKKRDSCVDVDCMDDLFSQWDKVAAAKPPTAAQTREVATVPREPAAVPDKPALGPERPAKKATRKPSSVPGRIEPVSPSQEQQPASSATPLDNASTEDPTETFWSRYSVWVGTALAALVMVSFLGWSTNCPNCHRWFSARKTGRTLIGQDVEFETAMTGTTTHQEQVHVKVRRYLVAHRCSACNHEWASRQAVKSAV